MLNSAGDSNFPQVVAAGPGDFRVAWVDSAAGAGLYNVRYQRIGSGFQTVGPVRTASNAGTGAAYKSANGFAFPYGDYFEMDASASGRAYLIWGEGVSYSGAGGVWYTRSRR